jgi:hypothetical protein
VWPVCIANLCENCDEIEHKSNLRRRHIRTTLSGAPLPSTPSVTPASITQPVVASPSPAVTSTPTTTPSTSTTTASVTTSDPATTPATSSSTPAIAVTTDTAATVVAPPTTTTTVPVVAATAAPDGARPVVARATNQQPDLASIEGLDALVDRLRSVRSEAQGGAGSDEERRRRAAQAVYAMMGQLGLEDDAEDDTDM